MRCRSVRPGPPGERGERRQNETLCQLSIVHVMLEFFGIGPGNGHEMALDSVCGVELTRRRLAEGVGRAPREFQILCVFLKPCGLVWYENDTNY